jgi:hypothetical protein
LDNATKYPAFFFDGIGIGANGVASDDKPVARGRGFFGRIGIAALSDFGVVSCGIQRPAAVHDANFQQGKRLGMVALDSDVFVIDRPYYVVGYVALLAEATVSVAVIYPVDGAARRCPALIETDCHGGRILLENPDGLPGVDLSDAVRVDNCDVLGT